MSNTMVAVDHVTKQYRLGMIGGTTLKEELQSRMARWKHQEDPNLKIGMSEGKRNEKFLALDDITFSVEKGEAVGIIGHNGAGKSTLLKLITKITAPTSGQIGLNGRIASMLETGRENIYMNGAILGMTKAEIDRKIEEIIEFSEVRQFIDTPVKRYSSGMYVKLAFSVAAHLDSEIMIMDEVLAVGDMAFQQKCLKKMRDAATLNGKTVLYVSHNMMTIRSLCDRCIVLEHGKIVFDGDVEEAIRIYMGMKQKEYPCLYDMKDARRQLPGQGEAIHINTVSLPDRTNAIYHSGEKLRVCIEWESKINVDQLRVYFVFYTLAKGSIGIMQSEPCMQGEENGKYKTFFELDISELFAGEYQIVTEIYRLDEGFEPIKYDHPEKRIYIKILDEKYKGITWVQGYGNVKLQPVTCVSHEEIK